MKYAMIGAGNVGKALARAFNRKGIDVALTSRRSVEELTPVAESIGSHVTATVLRDAISADVLFLATPFKTHPEVAKAAESWEGKIIVDVTNAYGVSPEDLGNLPSSLVISQAFPGAALVKAFNHLPAKVLAEDPDVKGGRRVIFLSSEDEDAAGQVATLVEQLGFAPVQLGKLNQGGLLVQARGGSWAQLIFQDFVKFS